MKIKSEITFSYKNKEDAKHIYQSLEVDNENYLKSELDNEKIIYKIENETPGSFLATADDLIASEIVSEKIIKTTKNR